MKNNIPLKGSLYNLINKDIGKQYIFSIGFINN